MNLTNEQIDTAIAALRALKEKREPRIRWAVVDRDGDTVGRLFRTEDDARRELLYCNQRGTFKPYVLYRSVEVTE